ncbi:MAG: FHA domain-containing protein [Gemmatimonadota bacterium]|nr:FHA domain-containing protein [Gemmatimonadota bacterium]
MPFLIVAAKRIPLRAGKHVLGGDDAEAPTGQSKRFAVIEVDVDGAAWIIATRQDVDVLVNGVALSGKRMQLAHGAKIDIAGRKLVFGDERFASGTSNIAGVTDAEVSSADDVTPPSPSSDTGGTLIGADGVRYPVPETGLDIGRDPNCDVVIAADDVSRWHAQIAPGLLGYQLKDSSTNGVYVNGQRVHGERWLSVGDTIRVGDVQFRFEADAASYEPSISATDTSDLPRMAATPPREPVETPSPTETVRLSRRTESAMPEPPLLATLELLSNGVLKGKRFRITRPLIHIGRGAHNDISLPDKSVSGAHAKLQRRGSDWYVVDAESRNGTYVDGERVTGERQLSGACEIRFGGVKALFRALAAAGQEDPSTRAVVGIMDAQIDKKTRR